MNDPGRVVPEPEGVVELVTGALTDDEYDDAVAAVAGFFVARDVAAVLVTCMFGCDFRRVDPLTPTPVAPLMLAGFLDDLEGRGIWRPGRSDLHLEADGGGGEFLLCEEADIHFYTRDPGLFAEVRGLWAESYPGAYEADRADRRWRDLKGGPWQPFGEVAKE